ncbi:MAG: TrkA C-terminal domain-containing protein, partial [Bacteriovoracaceae bacterium]|nr:TrkA C-terminal domain-containing protein [Bacteriovoracaceae bacterium]
VSAITTFTTPYLIRWAIGSYDRIEQKIPERFKNSLIRYQQAITLKGEQGVWSVLWEAYGVRVLLNAVVIIGIALLFNRVAIPQVIMYFSDSYLLRVTLAFLALLVSAPFFWAVFFGKPSTKVIHEHSSLDLLRNLLVGVTFVRVLIGTLLVAFLFAQFVDIYFAITGTIVVVIIASLFFRNIVERLYQNIENRFIRNLNAKEREELEKKKAIPALAPWDAVLSEFVVSPVSEVCGKTLLQSQLKEKFGVTIALIERGERRFVAPGRDVLLMSYDRLHLIGTEEQLTLAKELIEGKDHSTILSEVDANYGLESFLLSTSSPYIQKSIRECGLRENIDGLIVGLERNGKRFLSPDSQMILEAEDLLWVVGDIRKIHRERIL